MFDSIIGKVDIPALYTLEQTFDRRVLKDYLSILKQKLCYTDIKQGQTIAVTAGSRGIAGYTEIIKAITQHIASKGARPVLVPSMGSHGGGTEQGQKEVLKKLGISSEIAEITSRGSDVDLGRNCYSNPVCIGSAFLEADGVILFNRIKPHTSFRGDYESGIVKMAAIGMGGPKGAATAHAAGFLKMTENIVSAANIIFSKINIICAAATVENAYGEIAQLEVLQKEEIMKAEPQLLKRAWTLMPKLPADEFDVLIVDEIGKDISGTGMDTNIIGRFHTKAAYGGPDINKIIVLGLSEKAGGNANGIGLADFTTRRLFNEIDFEATYLNVLTTTEPASAKLPPIMDTDELAIKAGIFTCNNNYQKNIKIIRIKNTKQLDSILVTQNLL